MAAVGPLLNAFEALGTAPILAGHDEIGFASESTGTLRRSGRTQQLGFLIYNVAMTPAPAREMLMELGESVPTMGGEWSLA